MKAVRWVVAGFFAGVAVLAMGGTEVPRGPKFAPLDDERSLLAAAKEDRRYLPRWELANFYFRRGDWPNFWIWARRAAEMHWGDWDPLLKLCDAADPGHVLDHIEDAYLDFLIRDQRLVEAQSIARRILAHRSAAETARLADFVDRQIRAGDGASAVEIWNGIASPVSVTRPLSNGALSTAPSGAGFDWRLQPAGEWHAGKFTFSFQDFDTGPLAEQFVMVIRMKYKLRFEYRSSQTGIRWTLDDTEGPALDPADTWRGGESTISSSKAGLARLRLIYRREPGARRANGRFEIRNIRMEAL